MAGFDYDVVIIGSGFGGSVAAQRAANTPAAATIDDFRPGGPHVEVFQ